MNLIYQKTVMRVFIGVITGLFFCNVFALAAGSQEINKTFKNKTTIKIELVSGNCNVKKSTGGSVEVKVAYNYRPAEKFTPRFTEKEGTLILKEETHGQNKGNATWTLAVPDNTKIEFSSASGSFSLTGLETSVSVRTGSGNIQVSNSRGMFTIQNGIGNVKLQDLTGTITANNGNGKIEIQNATGIIRANTGSGNISASGIELKGMSELMSAAGNVQVVLAKTPGYNLMVSSATSKATLNYNGNPLRGYFEFQAKVSGGKIVSPIRFTTEKKAVRNGETYIIKSFSKEGGKPKIQVLTASGQAVLLEK